MLYCLATVIGVILGAGIMSYKLRVMNPAERDVMMKPQASVEDAKGISENTAEREKLQKQWENFMNYDGSADGQEEIYNAEDS